MLRHPKAIGVNGKGIRHRTSRRHKAAVGNVEIIHLMTFAMFVQYGAFGVIAKAASSCLKIGGGYGGNVALNTFSSHGTKEFNSLQSQSFAYFFIVWVRSDSDFGYGDTVLVVAFGI